MLNSLRLPFPVGSGSCTHARPSMERSWPPWSVVSWSHDPDSGFQISMEPFVRPIAARSVDGGGYAEDEVDGWENTTEVIWGGV